MRAKFVDVAGSDTTLLLEIRRAVVDDRADAIVIGVPVAIDGPLGDAIRVGAVPVLLTLPIADPAALPGGGFTFALAPAPADIARAVVDDLVARSLVQPMLLAGDDSRAAALERSVLASEMKHRSLTAPSAVNVKTPDAAQ